LLGLADNRIQSLPPLEFKRIPQPEAYLQRAHARIQAETKGKKKNRRRGSVEETFNNSGTA
jgi:hypothetical protein